MNPFEESRLMPPNSMEMVRRRFLQLPQLQKTLVFGGLGMLSGWLTTLIVVLTYHSEGMRAAALAAYLVPGPILWLVVATPMHFLASGDLLRWVWSLLIVPFILPAAFAALLVCATNTPNNPLQSWNALPVAVVGGAVGYALALCCIPRGGAKNRRAVDVTIWSLAAAALLIVWVESRMESDIPGLPASAARMIRWAVLFVTLHSVAAACLSLRAWPNGFADSSPESPGSLDGWARKFAEAPAAWGHEPASQPPLDEPATLPP
ncbi:MAG TPA: hypothetical protein VL132_12200 [Planctomycetaceae bacterium]|nr:hypothetical protein [Planctomycetaceae bacterium]